MAAVSKNPDFLGMTPKGLIHHLIKEGKGYKEIAKTLKTEFRRFKSKDDAYTKKQVLKVIKALYRGRLKYQLLQEVNVPPPTELITVQGIKFDPPKSFLKALEKKSKGKKASAEDEEEDEDDFNTEEANDKPSKKSKDKKPLKKSKPKPEPEEEEEDLDEEEEEIKPKGKTKTIKKSKPEPEEDEDDEIEEIEETDEEEEDEVDADEDE